MRWRKDQQTIRRYLTATGARVPNGFVVYGRILSFALRVDDNNKTTLAGGGINVLSTARKEGSCGHMSGKIGWR